MQNKCLCIISSFQERNNRHSWRPSNWSKTFQINGNLWVFLNCIRYFAYKAIVKLPNGFKNNQVVLIKWNIWSFTHVRRSHLVRYLVLCTLNSKKQSFLYNSARKNFHKKCQNLQNSRRFLLNRVSLLLVCVYSFGIKMNTKISFYCLLCL